MAAGPAAAREPLESRPVADAGPPQAWLQQTRNQGWIYRERVPPSGSRESLIGFYARRYRHSSADVWRQRLALGQIRHNGRVVHHDASLSAGDRLAWHRPPWLEDAVPARWPVLFDDGDLHVIDKPSGLPVLPAGGWLEHTLLRLLERRHGQDPGGIPRPVHRLGRFTSGLLVCARRPATRAWLSARLRESTATGLTPAMAGLDPCASPAGAEAAGTGRDAGRSAGSAGCRKVYRAWLPPGLLRLEPGGSLAIAVPIGRRPHPLLGWIWCAADGSQPGDLPARSVLTLLERAAHADLVSVAIASGRPHQIRIHCAALGAPLLGDPLYRPGGGAAAEGRPGEGGYRLQAWRLEIERPSGGLLELQLPDPLGLEAAMAPPSS